MKLQDRKLQVFGLNIATFYSVLSSDYLWGVYIKRDLANRTKKIDLA